MTYSQIRLVGKLLNEPRDTKLIGGLCCRRSGDPVYRLNSAMVSRNGKQPAGANTHLQTRWSYNRIARRGHGVGHRRNVSCRFGPLRLDRGEFRTRRHRPREAYRGVEKVDVILEHRWDGIRERANARLSGLDVREDGKARREKIVSFRDGDDDFEHVARRGDGRG